MKLIILVMLFVAPVLSVLASGDNKINFNQSHSQVEVFFGNNAEESIITLEEWMKDADWWNFPGEESLELKDAGMLESWMSSADHWLISVDDDQSVSDVILEPWMFDPCHWKFISRNICDLKYNNDTFPTEENLIQSWMKNPYFFHI